MSSNSTLMVHCGGIRRTREELSTLHTPSPTPTWRPVPHAELVAALTEGLAARGVAIVREEFCTLGRDDAKLLGTLDLRIDGLDSPDLAMGLGLRAGNDRTLAIQFVAACRVFVCDNWAFSGSSGAVFLKRKHTARLDVRAVVPSTLEQFLERASGFRLDIGRMPERGPDRRPGQGRSCTTRSRPASCRSASSPSSADCTSPTKFSGRNSPSGPFGRSTTPRPRP